MLLQLIGGRFFLFQVTRNKQGQREVDTTELCAHGLSGFLGGVLQKGRVLV